MHLTTLTLSSFRNHARYDLCDLTSGFTAFIGPNGAGKTNILEAISLLAPGRGLRSADLADCQARDVLPMTAPWAVHATLQTPYGPQQIGVGIDPITTRRRVHVNGAPLKSTADWGDMVRVVWLTPREDRLFMDSASVRRKWFDRLVFVDDPAHAGRLTRLDRLLAERNRLLSLPRADPLWLDTLEADLAATALAVAVARVDFIDRLRTVMQSSPPDDFPAAQLQWQGYVEDQIGQAPSVQIEDRYRGVLRDMRGRDSALGATSLGPHRADLSVVYTAKGMPAAQCSTGEQKALLLQIFLAHGAMVSARVGAPPLVLLDEIGAHLDPARRALLYDRLAAVRAQVFLTATTEDQVQDAPGVRVERIGDLYPQPMPESIKMA